MDNSENTDDDRQTPSNGHKSLPDDISSVTSETLLPVHENDQRHLSKMLNVRVCSVKVNSCSSLPNLNIKHPDRPDDGENNPFNDKRRIIRNKHVQVTHIDRSNRRRLITDISLSRLKACSRQKSTSTITVSRGNQRLSQSINGNLNNRETTQMTSRQNTVRISRISTAANIHKGPNKNKIGSKPVVTRVSLANELPLKPKQQELHVSVQHVSLHSTA